MHACKHTKNEHKILFYSRDTHLILLGNFPVLSSPRKYYSWDYKGIRSGTLDVYSRKRILRIVLQRCFCYWRKRYFWYVFVNHFRFQRSGLCWFLCEISVAFFLIGCTAFGNTSILCGILNICYKTKTKSAGQKEVFLQKPQKTATKLCLLPWKSELWASVSARAIQNFQN